MDAEFNKTTDTQNQFQQPQTSASQSSQKGNSDLFSRHNDSVLCCSIDSRNRLAVSGGIDDTAFVWDLNTKHVIFECLDHKESVVAAAFSLNSTYVATGDLNGYIQVRNTTTGIKVFDYEIDEINWILWHNTSEFVLLAGTTKGDFWMWNVNDPAAVKTFTSYGSACTAARILPDGMKMIVAYQDGSVRLFDLKTRQAISKLDKSCNAEIICLDINSTKSIMAVGCINSSVKLITLGVLKEIGDLSCKSLPASEKKESIEQPMDEGEPEEEEPQSGEAGGVEVIDEFTETDNANGQVVEEEDENEVDDDEDDDDDDDEDGMSSGSAEFVDQDSVESVLFSPCGGFLAGANNSGTITIWDVSSQAKRCELQTGVGITRCVWTSDGRYITGSLDGKVRVYDINLNQLICIEAHRDQILDLALKEKFLVTASEDKTCRVTKV